MCPDVDSERARATIGLAVRATIGPGTRRVAARRRELEPSGSGWGPAETRAATGAAPTGRGGGLGQTPEKMCGATSAFAHYVRARLSQSNPGATVSMRIPSRRLPFALRILAPLTLAGCAATVPPSQMPPAAPPAEPPVAVTGNAESYLATIQANRALIFHQYGDAIRWFEIAAMADPQSPYLQTTLSKVYFDLGQPERALEHLKHALALDPGYSDAQFQLARIYATTDPARAAQSYESILAANPQDPGALFQLALLRVRQNRLDDAVALLTRLVAVDPQSFQARSTLAQVQASLGQYAEAEQQFRAALDLQPESERALIELAMLYERWGKADQAAATYGKVLEINPDNHQVRKRLSRLLIQQSRLGEAVTELEELKKRDPEPAEARLGLGLIFLEQDRIEDAITELELLLKERPEMVKVAYYLGLARAKKGDVDGALDAFAKVGPELPEYVDEVLG